MTLITAIENIQSKASDLSGIRAAPTYPPEASADFPFAVSYPRAGELQLKSAGFAKFYHTVITEIHVARQILPEAIETALPYAERLASAVLNDPTLASTVDEVRGLRYTFGKLEWGGVQTIGYRFEVDIKCDCTT